MLWLPRGCLPAHFVAIGVNGSSSGMQCRAGVDAQRIWQQGTKSLVREDKDRPLKRDDSQIEMVPSWEWPDPEHPGNLQVILSFVRYEPDLQKVQF